MQAPRELLGFLARLPPCGNRLRREVNRAPVVSIGAPGEAERGTVPVAGKARVAVLPAHPRNLARGQRVGDHIRRIPHRRLATREAHSLQDGALVFGRRHHSAVHADAQRAAADILQRTHAEVARAQTSSHVRERVCDLGGRVVVARKDSQQAPRAALLLSPSPQLVLADPLLRHPLDVVLEVMAIVLLTLHRPPRPLVSSSGPDVEHVVVLVLDVPLLRVGVRPDVRVGSGGRVSALCGEVSDVAGRAKIDVERVPGSRRNIPGACTVVAADNSFLRHLGRSAAQQRLELRSRHALGRVGCKLDPQLRLMALDLVDMVLELVLRAGHDGGREELPDRLEQVGGLERAVRERALLWRGHRVLLEQRRQLPPRVAALQRIRRVAAVELESRDAVRLLQTRHGSSKLVLLNRVSQIPKPGDRRSSRFVSS
eukprot:1844285-Rhodomonas_salina.3